MNATDALATDDHCDGARPGENGKANGSHDKETAQPRRRSAFRALVQDFSPVWFTWCMNTGICSTILHQLPYQFHGIKVISTVLYIVDLLLFILFSALMVLRFAIYRGQAAREIAADVNELCFMACLPISWMTLTTLTALIVSNASWGGYAFTVVAYVMWWIAVAWTLGTTFVVYIILTKKSLTEAKTLSLAIILPAVATATTAAEGGLLSIYAVGISSRLAIPVIIVSFMLVGIGVWLATLIYALFLQRMVKTGWPEPLRRPSLMIAVGPMGQSSTALLALGTASMLHFGNYQKGTFLQSQQAMSLHAACVLLSLMMFGFGVFWVIYGLYGILEAVFKKQISWTPAWYSTIFPVGTMCTSLILFSEEMDAPAFRVLAAGLCIILILNVLINFGYTVRAIVRGKVLIVRENPRSKKTS